MRKWLTKENHCMHHNNDFGGVEGEQRSQGEQREGIWMGVVIKKRGMQPEGCCQLISAESGESNPHSFIIAITL